jgi:hypothetical protein
MSSDDEDYLAKARRDYAEEQRRTEIVKAAHEGNVDRVRLLLDSGVDPNTKTKYGFTALDSAVRFGYTDIARLLLNAGATINPNSLIAAAKGGHDDMVNLLLDKGADINERYTTGQSYDSSDTPLHEASDKGNVSTVRILLERGAEVDAKNSDGTTPLYAVVTSGSIGKDKDREAIVRMLLERNADPEIKNRGGWPIMNWARGKVKTMLEEAIAKREARRRAGATMSALDVSPAGVIRGLKADQQGKSVETVETPKEWAKGTAGEISDKRLPPQAILNIGRFMAEPDKTRRRAPRGEGVFSGSAPSQGGIYAPGAGAGPGPVGSGRRKKSRKTKKRRFSRRR